MPRFFRRRGSYRRAPKRNYQIMRPWYIIDNQQANNGFQTVIDPATVTGVRKTKNFSIDFGVLADAQPTVLVWALVYVPAGYVPNNLADAGNTMYQPTNNVIMSGIYDSADPGNTSRRTTRLSRLLKAGDGIALVYRSNVQPTQFRFQLTYAIAL